MADVFFLELLKHLFLTALMRPAQWGYLGGAVALSLSYVYSISFTLLAVLLLGKR